MTLAELIVKLSVKGESEVRRGVGAVRLDLRRAEEAASGFGQAVATAAKSMGLFAAVVGGVGVASAVAAGKSAFDAAVKYESLVARMTALTGSADEAAKKLRLVQQVANPSAFTFDQLAQASVALEAFGLRTERVLPSLAKLGQAFAADEEHLKMLTSMFGKLAQGDFPDLEQLTAFGLSRSQFREQGIQFDGNGKLLSGTRETLDALERIINQKYGGIFTVMQSTTEAKLASLSDAWQKFTVAVGGGIATVLTPGIERMGRALTALVDSGVLQEVVASISQSIMGIQALSSDDGLLRVIANISAFMKNLPGMIESIGRISAGFLELWFDGIKTFINALTAGLPALLGSVGQTLAAGLSRIAGSLNLTQGMQTAMGVAGGVLSAGLGDPLAGADDMFNRMKQFMKPGDQTLPAATGGWGKLSEIAQEQDDKLGAIATNTRETRDFLALRQQTLGGGSLARLGVSSAEMAAAGAGRMKAGMGFGGSTAVTGGNQIERHIRRIIQDEVRRTGGQPMRRS